MTIHVRSLLIAALLAATNATHAQGTATRATVDSLAGFFAGKWSCEGKFSSGAPIAADVVFAPALDGKWLSYSHVDRLPGRFKMNSYWGLDAATKGLVSAGADNGGGLRIFRAPGWTDGTVTFERAALGDSLTRHERFIYKKESESTFRMTYEVSARGAWFMGDFVVCSRMP
ncbi:MAG: hypothetical protein JWM95_3393 [Gemmatimonadetes bacterium]|nr:hypothetical protein [Gemmatimonadota bacterium]